LLAVNTNKLKACDTIKTYEVFKTSEVCSFNGNKDDILAFFEEKKQNVGY
jgi:uncharacterized protein (UPF0333 family)